MGVVAKRRDQVGVALVHLLERKAATLLHQVDETEVARTQHDRVLVVDVVLALLAGRAPCRLAERVTDHRGLLVAASYAAHAAACKGALDELVEPVAIALLERRALGLA